MYKYCLDSHAEGPDGVIGFYIRRSLGNYRNMCDQQIACLRDWTLLTRLGFDNGVQYNIYNHAYEDNAEQSMLRNRAQTLFDQVLHIVAATVHDQQ
eukprot:6075552-Karenia_brevis.AAC.1